MKVTIEQAAALLKTMLGYTELEDEGRGNPLSPLVLAHLEGALGELGWTPLGYSLLQIAQGKPLNVEGSKWGDLPRIVEYLRGVIQVLEDAMKVKRSGDALARLNAALDIARENAEEDAPHHRAWVIDQIVQALAGSEYETWIALLGCEWDRGIAP